MSGEGTQADGQATGGSAHDYEEYARFGIAAYLVLGLGIFITSVLNYFLFDEDSVMYSSLADEASLFVAAQEAFELLPLLGPILAVALGYYYWRSSEVSTELYQPVAIASLLGVLVLGLVLILLLVIFEPDGFDVGFGDELPSLIGIALGTAIVGAATGAVAENVLE